MLEAATSNPWSKPTSGAKTNAAERGPFVKQYSFHLDPSTGDVEHVLMTKDISTNTKMEENKSTDIGSGSSPGTNPAVRGNIEDIWNETVGSPTKNPDRRRNELSSDDEIDDGTLGNGESKAGFISRRPSMTAELETRIRQVRLSEGSSPDRPSGPSSPNTSSKWGLYGMNWTSQNTILGERNTTPPTDQPPISPLARFHQSSLDPPARQISPTNTNTFGNARPRFQQTAAVDPNQRVQRSQSFSVGDHTGYPSYLTATGQTPPLPRGIFNDDPTRPFKSSGLSGYPASPLARAPIAEEIDEFDASLRTSEQKETSPSRYADRGRSLSTSAASHGYTRGAQMGEDAIEEAIYEEDEETALNEFEPLSRSRTLPADPNILGYSTSRYIGLTERERLERQRGQRQSPRIVDEIPSVRRQDSFSGTTWDDSRHRSPPRSDYSTIPSTYDYDANTMDSPGSIHSFPGMRSDYPSINADVQNYFNNDNDRRRQAAEQFQFYQLQNRYRFPSYQSHDPPSRPFPFHDPDQYTLHIVKFKANRMDVFYLAKEKRLDLEVKDYVIVDGDRGTDLGMVSKVNVSESEARSLTAQLQREQAAATAANQNGMNANAMEAIAAAASQVQERDVTIPKKFIHRLAVRGEIDGLQMKMQDEAQAKQVCEMKVQQRGLQMDILDVEYQWDRRKLYIYFIAPQRVDFVALVKDLFKIYKTRIWLHNSTASHVTSQLSSQPSSFQPPSQQPAQQQQQQQHDNTHEYQPHLQPQYDYFRNQPRYSPNQQHYLPSQHTPIYTSGQYYSPQQQTYYPSPSQRTYIPPPPPHMPFQSSGPPPPGHW